MNLSTIGYEAHAYVPKLRYFSLLSNIEHRELTAAEKQHVSATEKAYRSKYARSMAGNCMRCLKRLTTVEVQGKVLVIELGLREQGSRRNNQISVDGGWKVAPVRPPE